MRLRLLIATSAVLVALSAPSAHAAVPGVNVAGVPNPTNVSQVLASGAKYARFFLLWSDAEPLPGAPPDASLMATYSSALGQLQAAGVKTDLVITDAPQWANGSTDRAVPPTNAADMAVFMAQVASQLRGKVAAYEVWNEPDNPDFWHAAVDAARYTALLQAVYPAVKAADPSTTVLAGPFDGNDYDFLAQLYADGAKGSFDGVAVHTDTACLNTGPDVYYRDGSVIGQYSFLGYRTVHQTMVANNDPKPIWITELGWSSTTTTCARGVSAGKKPAGVGPQGQASALTLAYHCLSADPEVPVAEWFTLSDAGAADNELDRYGLLTSTGAPKPSYAAFQSVAKYGDRLKGACGDFGGPKITVQSPTANASFATDLLISASASDPDGLHRITFLADGKKLDGWGKNLVNGKVYSLDWLRAADLAPGKHTIEIQATDGTGNLSVVDISVNKVDVSALPVTKTKITAKVTGSGLVRTVTGRVTSSLPYPIKGRVQIVWEVLSGHKWVARHRRSANASKPFKVTQRLARAGKWKLVLTFAGAKPFAPSVAPSHTFIAH